MPRGDRLRALRLRRRLTMCDVEVETAKIAFRFSDKRYLVLRSHLSSYEKQRSAPSLYKFFSLLTVYHCSAKRLLGLLGIPGRTGGSVPLTIKSSTWMHPSPPPAKTIGGGERRRRKRLRVQ